MRSKRTSYSRFFSNIKEQFIPKNSLNFRRRRKKIQKERIKYVAIFGVEIVAVILFAFFMIRAFGIRREMLGDSMAPTIGEEQVVLINKVAYVFSEPKANDIIEFLPSGNLNAQASIKRVIAVPGDTVYISNGTLFVNDEVFKDVAKTESIANAGLADTAITLKDDEYFVLGDNRNNSEDSRYQTIGNISKANILGKVWLNVSLDNFGLVQ